MLSQKELNEIRALLEKAQNPLFFFDNDVDGLASFLLLRRYIERGKGVAIKSFPDLSVAYSRKIYELKPDFIFILDKPLVADGFFEAAEQLSLPIAWIDHHPPQETKKDVHYFNPLLGEPKSNEPTSYWCYKITKRKEDEWIALLGCLADWFVPDFAKDLSNDLFSYTKDPAKAFFETEIGRLAKMLSFALKDKTSAVIRLLKFLLTVKDPHELLDLNRKTAQIYKRFKQINRKYEKLIEKAKEIEKEKEPGREKKVLFFQYAGDLSLSSELANELFYLFPQKIVVAAYIKGTKVNVSVRGKEDVRDLTKKALSGIESTAGGHKQACGASLSVEDLPKFRDNFIRLAR